MSKREPTRPPRIRARPRPDDDTSIRPDDGEPTRIRSRSYRDVSDNADETPRSVRSAIVRDYSDPPRPRPYRDALASDADDDAADDAPPPSPKPTVGRESKSGPSEGYGGRPGTDRARFLEIRNVGRPVGSQNRISVALKEGAVIAATQVGFDGNGEDGLVGYLKRLAISEPAVFGQILRRLMPHEVKASVDPGSTLGQALEAVRARIQIERARTVNGSTVIDVPARPRWRN